MFSMEILKYPNPILRQEAKPVADEDFNDGLKQLAHDMLQTMYEHGGVGLAAPQVGQSIRLVVVDFTSDHSKPLTMVNPIILKTEGKQSYEEGCLSFPGTFSRLQSAEKIEVIYRDLNGFTHEETFDGLAAVAIQHEVDHLDGKLFLDRMKKKEAIKVKTRAFGGKG